MTKEQRLEIMKAIISIDSTNGNEAAVADCLADYLEKVGIKTSRLTYEDGRDNLIAEIGVGERVFGLSGHMDVVAAGDLSAWVSPPFVPTERDGCIFARGACDMKGGLAALACAMIELTEEKVKLNGRVRLLGTVGEEIGTLGATQLTQKGYADDIEAMIIAEPSDHQIVSAHKGVVTYTVVSRGVSVHTSTPENGINALDNIILFYQRINKEFSKLTEENPLLGKFVNANTVLHSGEQINSVPDIATFRGNLRTTPEVPNEKLETILKQVVEDLNGSIPGMDLTLSIDQSSRYVFTDPEAKLIQILREESKKQFNETWPEVGSPGGTDASQFIVGNPDMQIVILGPGNESLHQVNEFIPIDAYLEMIDLYKSIIVKYLS